MSGVRRHEVIGALALCALLLTWNHLLADRLPGTRAIDPLADLLVAAASLALIQRRAAPRRALAVVVPALTGYLVLGYPYGPVFLPLVIAVYTVGRRLPWRSAAVAGAITIPVLALHNLGDGAGWDDLAGLLPSAGWVAVPLLIGTLRAHLEETVRRDHREAVDRGLQEERLRVAQEVHDIVGHGLAAIKMQADIALHVLARQPDVARPTLEAISTTSAQALEELRVTLSMLRSTAQASTPGIADLDALYERMRHAGLTLRVRSAVPAGALPSEVDLAVYRTIQESLTNVLKHADPKEAHIVLANEPGALRISVTSRHPPGARPPGDGLGIAGMRERIAAHGGRLAAGPAAGARFVVEAWLPAGPP